MLADLANWDGARLAEVQAFVADEVGRALELSPDMHRQYTSIVGELLQAYRNEPVADRLRQTSRARKRLDELLGAERYARYEKLTRDVYETFGPQFDVN